MSAGQFLWGDVQTRREDVDDASLSGDEWATCWLLIELSVIRMRFHRTGLFPEWVKPLPNKSKSDVERGFYRQWDREEAALYSRVGISKDLVPSDVANPFLRYHYRNGGSEDRVSLLLEAFDAGFSGATGPMVSMAQSWNERKKFAKIAAEQGLSEYTLSEAQFLFRPMLGSRTDEEQQVASSRAVALCKIVGKAGDPDGYAMMGAFSKAAEKGSVLGMHLYGVEIAQTILAEFDKADAYYGSDSETGAEMRERAAKKAGQVRELIGPAAAQGQFYPLYNLGELEELIGNRDAARRWYEMAEHAAFYKEQRDMAREARRDMSKNPLKRLFRTL